MDVVAMRVLLEGFEKTINQNIWFLFKLIVKLTELELFKEMTGQVRNRRFRYEPYVRLFFEDAGQE